MKIVIAYNHPWYKSIVTDLSGNMDVSIHTIEKKEDLTYENLKKINPKYVFFPHWSYIIPSEIYDNFECIIFHMTDVPFGRGGSPLQNLISRGIYETKISALKCVKELDAGPVYLKKYLSLHGNAEEIYIRAAEIIKEMIVYIIKHNPKPVSQEGEVTYFPRRKPHEGDISNLSSLRQVYDFIRMLDAEGYPRAFIETENFIFEFERASLKHDYIHADVKIRRKENRK
jgi:methionyl-tRNA formyltransferase